MTQAGGMVFLPLKFVCRSLPHPPTHPPRFLRADSAGLCWCGKHCHLLGPFRMSVDPVGQTPSGVLNVSTSATSAAIPSGSTEELLHWPEYRDNQLDLVVDL